MWIKAVFWGQSQIWGPIGNLHEKQVSENCYHSTCSSIQGIATRHPIFTCPLQPPGRAGLSAWLWLELFGQCPFKDSYCWECSHWLCNCSADGVMVSLRIQPSNGNDTAGLSCLMGSFPLYYNCDFQLNNSKVFLDPLRWKKMCWIYNVGGFLLLLFILLCFLFPLN